MPGFALQVSLDSGDTSTIVDGACAAVTPAPTDAQKTTPAARSAVAHSPTDPDTYITGASDGYLRKWSVSGRRLVTKVAVGSASSSTEGSSTGGDDGVVVAPVAGVGGDGGSICGKASRKAPGIGAVRWASGTTGFVLCGLFTGDVVVVSPANMTVLSRQALVWRLVRRVIEEWDIAYFLISPKLLLVKGCRVA